jgi:hypothetical protein
MASAKPLPPSDRRTPAKPDGRAARKAARAAGRPAGKDGKSPKSRDSKDSKDSRDSRDSKDAARSREGRGRELKAVGTPPKASKNVVAKKVARREAKKAAKSEKAARLVAEKQRQIRREEQAGQTITAERRAQLLALPDDYAASIDVAVKTITYEARELQDYLKKYGVTILSRSRLDPALVEDLPARIEDLFVTESLWRGVRLAALPEEQHEHEVEGAALRAAALSAFRHFLPRDKPLQAEIEDIAQGSGIPDLIDDLLRLAPLLTARAPDLAKAQLPPNAAARALQLAELIQTSTSEKHVDSPADEATKHLRNRAYWWLRAALDEIRECGRYAYERSSAMQKLFQGTNSRRRVVVRKPRPARPAPATPPEPTTPEPSATP